MIARLYNVDPHARIGHYDSEADFRVQGSGLTSRAGKSLAFLDVLADTRKSTPHDARRGAYGRRAFATCNK